MKVEGEYHFDFPRELVYKTFNDPDALQKSFPGMKKLEKIDESHYEATLGIRIGPVSANFNGNLALTDEVPPESVTLIIEGKGGAGFVKGTGYVTFENPGDNSTLLKYTGDAAIGGTLASVGQRMVDGVVKNMFKTVFDNLNKIMEEKWPTK